MMRLIPLLLLCLPLVACSGATRALLHENDMAKVFPWPSDAEQVQVRVKPETTAANMCFFFGSYETVTVDLDTTFYMEDETGKKFAYTPSLSPIRRLSRLKQAEIRWPHEPPEADEEAEAGEEDAAAGAKAAEDGKGEDGKGDEGKGEDGKAAETGGADGKAPAEKASGAAEAKGDGGAE